MPKKTTRKRKRNYTITYYDEVIIKATSSDEALEIAKKEMFSKGPCDYCFFKGTLN